MGKPLPRPALMSPEERRKLIEAPITTQTFGRTRQWAGTSFSSFDRFRPRAADNLPDNGYFSESWE